MARGDLMLEGKTLSVKEIEELLKEEIIGVIPQDDLILTAKNCYLDSRTTCGYAFYKLAGSVISGKARYLKVEKNYAGLIGSIKRGLRKII
jgi:septum formation inhibitor-activating ATPase MinD